MLLSDGGTPVLINSGLSRVRHEIAPNKTLLLSSMSPRYAAPELPDLRDEKFTTTEAGDIYSLAMTLYHLATLRRPYDEIREDEDVYAAVRSRKRPKFYPSPSNLDLKLWNLIQQMWSHEPQKRLSIDKIVSAIGSYSGEFFGVYSQQLVILYLGLRPTALAADSVKPIGCILAQYHALCFSLVRRG